MSAIVNDENRFSPVTADDHAGSLWIASLLCLIYSVLVVLVRTHLRQKIYGLDDVLILGAFLLQVGEAVAVIFGLRNGLGRTLFLLRSEDVAEASRATFAAQILFILSICFAKCSVVQLIMRLFNLGGSRVRSLAKSQIQWWLCILMLVFITVWGVASIVGLCVNCSSSHFIRIAAQSQCPNQVLRWQLITIFDVATEALLLLLTIGIVAPVQLDFSLKCQVVLAFSFRLLLIALAIVRLYAVKDFTSSSNPGLAIVPVLIVQQVYLFWAIISATIPNLKAFVRSFGSGFGIGIDAETLNNTNAHRKSQSEAIEMSSQSKKKSFGSRGSKSKENTSTSSTRVFDGRRSPLAPVIIHDEEMHPHAESEGSRDSENSERHIIRKDVQWKIHYESGGSGNDTRFLHTI